MESIDASSEACFLGLWLDDALELTLLPLESGFSRLLLLLNWLPLWSELKLSSESDCNDSISDSDGQATSKFPAALLNGDSSPST